MSTEVETQYDASAIQVLEGLEAVRKRPGMYIGSTGERGLHHLVYEIVDNSIDEALAGYCTHIEVDMLDDDTIRVRDNGRGIPVDIQQKTGLPAVTVVFTILHAGGKFGGGGYKVSGGLHGVGSSVVNALSKFLEVEVRKNGKVHYQRFEKGNTVCNLQIKGDCDINESGTTVTFKPDSEIFNETTRFDYDILLKRLREQAFLNAGIKITLTDMREDAEKDDNGEPRKDVLHYEGGIKSYCDFILERKKASRLLDDVIYVKSIGNGIEAEIALLYNTGYDTEIISFANNMHTVDGGTHENAFKTSLTRAINSYARKFKMLKDNDSNFKGDDVQEGLIAVVSVKLEDAQFESQTKAKLGNTAAGTLVSNAMSSVFNDYLEDNPAVAKLIVNKVMAASSAREKAQKAREMERSKNSGIGRTRMPDKLADCISRDATRTELFIVEGDSAGGSAKGGRDSNYQAILPLWGKMLNVEKARIDRVYGNDKLTPVVVALGTGIGDNFDISKLRYDKIIIMSDADVDGSHIQTLLMTFFFRYMPELIETNHVYIAMPPLFEVKKGKVRKFAFDEAERDEYNAQLGGNANIQRFKGLGEMNAELLWETTMDPAFRMLKRVSMNDAEKADEIFSVLMGDEVEPRRKFIEENAQYVENLDI